MSGPHVKAWDRRVKRFGCGSGCARLEFDVLGVCRRKTGFARRACSAKGPVGRAERLE